MAVLPVLDLAVEEQLPNMENALLVFAKKPELGKVKTRLAQDIGEENALQLYKQMLFSTFDVAESCEVYVLACFTEKDQITLDTIPYSGFYKQETGDLGFRMYKAIEHIKELGFQKTIVIGTDCPELTKEIITEAFDNLDKHDFVLGPALDGGYYLIGMKKNNAFVFEGLKWSADSVLTDTLKKIEEKQKTYYLLQSLSDIDTVEDLKLNKRFSHFL